MECRAKPACERSLDAEAVRERQKALVHLYFRIGFATACCMAAGAPIGRWLSVPWGIGFAALNFLGGTAAMVFTAHKLLAWSHGVAMQARPSEEEGGEPCVGGRALRVHAAAAR